MAVVTGVIAGYAANHMLLQSRERPEWIDYTVVQVELSFGDKSGVVRYRMGYIVARHRGDRENRNRAALSIIACLLVPAWKL